ncbi:hypothetical protein FQZ97_1017490 [compost metagenome]
MEAAEHVADHARALHGLGAHGAVGAAEAQAHARHRVQDAPLHRLLAVGHIGQRAALDHAQGVFEVGGLRVVGQREGGVAVGGACKVERRLRVVHEEERKKTVAWGCVRGALSPK